MPARERSTENYLMYRGEKSIPVSQNEIIPTKSWGQLYNMVLNKMITRCWRPTSLKQHKEVSEVNKSAIAQHALNLLSDSECDYYCC